MIMGTSLYSLLCSLVDPDHEQATSKDRRGGPGLDGFAWLAGPAWTVWLAWLTRAGLSGPAWSSCMALPSPVESCWAPRAENH